MDNHEIYDYIKEFLKFNNFTNTFECLEAEIRTKQVSNKLSTKQGSNQHTINKLDDQPRLYQLIKGVDLKSKRETNLEKDLKNMNKKYNQVLQAARPIFSVSVNCLQLLHTLKEVILYKITIII